MLDTLLFCLLILAVGILWMVAFKRRNNPTYPDHGSLDDCALDYEHSEGRLLDIPLKDPIARKRLTGRKRWEEKQRKKNGRSS